MKLQPKLIILSTVSKALMAAVVLLALPWVVQTLALRHTDAALRRELWQVQARIRRDGIGEFLPQMAAGQHTHYDLLQNEFIDLQPEAALLPKADTIATLPRRRQGETTDFRVLRHHGAYAGLPYVFEIGKSIASVEEMDALLRTLAAYGLIFAVLTTLLFELGVIGYLLRPVDEIVARLRAVQGPVVPVFPPLNTSTSDFQYLDASIKQMLAKIQTVFEQEREFIANASHELLTPIAILQNRFENMLRAENLPESAETYLVQSQKTLQRMTATLRTLLLISRVENNQFARTEQVDVREVLAEVVEELEDRIAELGLAVDWQLPEPPVLAPANRSLMFTLLFNLVSNAVKYNRPGGRIALHGEPLPAAGGYTLAITNTGKPIPPEALPRLFERFSRFDETAAEGYGLGLTVVRSIAQLHGIAVAVESDAAQGTTFRLRLP